jgi:drug/metabolite transporter (DMT)-like permease
MTVIWINYVGMLLSGFWYAVMAYLKASDMPISHDIVATAAPKVRQIVQLRSVLDQNQDIAGTTRGHSSSGLLADEDSEPVAELLGPTESVDTSILGNISPALVTVSVVDVIACALSMYALSIAGSGVYQVCYSSILVCTAALSRVFLNKKHSTLQWLAIVWVTFGLWSNAANASTSSSSTSSASLEEAARPPLYGIVLTLIATFIYACQYIAYEFLLTPSKGRTLPPAVVCKQVGIVGFTISSIYMAVETWPNRQEYVFAPIAAAHGTLWMASFWHVMLCISIVGHNVTYFNLVGRTGAVSTGVIQALRAVFVFGLSSVLFCSTQTSQCFTWIKTMSSCMVISGVLIFAYASSIRPKLSTSTK